MAHSNIDRALNPGGYAPDDPIPPSPSIQAAHEPELPRLVFAPARPIVRAGRHEILYEARHLFDGQQVLPVFTSLERLVRELGPAQPWAQCPLRALRALMHAVGIQHVVIDPAIATETWRWTPGELALYDEDQTGESHG